MGVFAQQPQKLPSGSYSGRISGDSLADDLLILLFACAARLALCFCKQFVIFQNLPSHLSRFPQLLEEVRSRHIQCDVLYLDADSKMQGLQGNRSFYSNPQVDTLIRETATTSDTAKRTELYQQAQKVVLNDSAYVYLYQKSYTLPMRDSVKGYVFNPMLEQVFNLGSMSK